MALPNYCHWWRPGVMLKTLHGYIARDLIKIFLLVFIILTMLLTIIIIIEPLRKQGLAGSEVLFLFGLTVPMMAPFTLPFSALFAATFIYGRFSQDNELLAAKASGVGTVCILRPALALGVIVMVISMILSNFISPRLAQIGQRHFEANLRGIVRNQIETKGHFKYSAYIVSADPSSIEIGEDDQGPYLKLKNVVAVDASKIDNVMMITATEAIARFTIDTERNEYYVTIEGTDGCEFTTGRDQRDDDIAAKYPVAGSPGGYIQSGGAVGPLTFPPLPMKSSEKPSFFEWPMLVKTLRAPHNHPEIRREMDKLKMQIKTEMILKAFAMQIADADGKGVKLSHINNISRSNETITILPAKVEQSPDGDINLSGLSEGKYVELFITSDKETSHYRADSGRIVLNRSEMSNQTFVNIELKDNVKLIMDNGIIERDDQSWGEIPL
ncbi:MAG TPA: LptF/LptG family permease, partial [Phycisphaerae bacterium]|nr:LptF/LptG family permease [Phycisphaerae bacterium]